MDSVQSFPKAKVTIGTFTPCFTCSSSQQVFVLELWLLSGTLSRGAPVGGYFVEAQVGLALWHEPTSCKIVASAGSAWSTVLPTALFGRRLCI